jgi:hypothetical protein
MVRRVVARRVYPDRRDDRRLEAECRVVLVRLPSRERAAFLAELRRRPRSPQALGLAIEAAARRALMRRRAVPLLIARDRRRP